MFACPYCDIEVDELLAEAHAAVCKNAPVECSVPGCGNRLQRRQLAVHKVEAVHDHLDMVMALVLQQREEINKLWSTANKQQKLIEQLLAAKDPKHVNDIPRRGIREIDFSRAAADTSEAIEATSFTSPLAVTPRQPGLSKFAVLPTAVADDAAGVIPAIEAPGLSRTSSKVTFKPGTSSPTHGAVFQKLQGLKQMAKPLGSSSRPQSAKATLSRPPASTAMPMLTASPSLTRRPMSARTPPAWPDSAKTASCRTFTWTVPDYTRLSDALVSGPGFLVGSHRFADWQPG